MAIVSCPTCQKMLKVADTSVGKKVKCSCGNIFVAAGDSPPAPVVDKVIVACTECSSKLKVASTSLGKNMKCPKCAAVFVAAEEGVAAAALKKSAALPPAEEEDVPAPAKKMSRKDEGDFLNFGAAEVEEELPELEVDEDAAPTPKKATELPRPKPRAAAPPALAGESEKLIYPSRVLANIFVTIVLLAYATYFVLVFMEQIETGMWEAKDLNAPPKRPPRAESPENKKDAEKLQGAWTVVSAEFEGKPRDDLKGGKFTFAGDKVTMLKMEESGYYLDAGKDPKWIDFNPHNAIYKFDGDDLHLCTNFFNKLAAPGGKEVDFPTARPSKFDSKEGILYVLKRDKNPDDGKKPDNGKKDDNGKKSDDKKKGNGKDKGKADGRAPAEGKITLDGKPLFAGEIWFTGEDKKVTKHAIEKGLYSGLVSVGKNKVEIYSFKDDPDPKAPKVNLIPPVYNVQSVLVVEVADRVNELNFDLKSR